MQKKKYIIAGGVTLAVLVVPLRADMFGGDLALLGQILAQSIQEVRLASQIYGSSVQAYQQARQAAAFVTSASYWKGMMLRNQAALSSPSTGADAIALGQLQQSRLQAISAITQTLNNPAYQPTAENAAMLSQLHVEAVNTAIEANRLAQKLKEDASYEHYVATEGPQWGGAAEALKNAQ